MKLRLFVLATGILIVLLFSTAPSIAQDDTLNCDTENINGKIASAQELLVQAQSALGNGDNATALALLGQAREDITLATSSCNNWLFQGDSPDVIGPLELDAGAYVLEYTSEVPEGMMAMGVLGIEFENLDEDEYVSDNIMEMRTEAGPFNGRQLVRLEGGSYLISVDVTGIKEWTLGLSKP